MDYDKYRDLLIERQGRVLTLTINRPESYNAVNANLHTELAQVFLDIANDNDTDAIVMTGAGKAFCAGGDLDWLTSISQQELDVLFIEARQIIMRMLEVEQPIVAAINGPATGLGATLALFCDITYIAEHAVIGDPHVRAGVVAGDGGAVIWPWLVGMARAKEYLLTGDILSANDAEKIGLVNHVCDAKNLLSDAQAMAQRLARGPRRAIRGTKAALNQLLRDTANIALDLSAMREKECFGTADQKEAMQAFMEKREPRFTGQ